MYCIQLLNEVMPQTNREISVLVCNLYLNVCDAGGLHNLSNNEATPRRKVHRTNIDMILFTGYVYPTNYLLLSGGQLHTRFSTAFSK